MKYPTLTTIKKFIRENRERLEINVLSTFDGMVDGCTDVKDGWRPANETSKHLDHTLGIDGAWFIKGRDFYDTDVRDGRAGYKVSNCCGSFVLATR